MTGARVNAPLVKDIIINIISLFNISKDKNDDLLKVDTNFLYRKLNATVSVSYTHLTLPTKRIV